MPEAERERIIEVVLKNPELFKKIGEEAQVYTKAGMDQTMAMMKVMQKYQSELQKVMKP